MMTVREDKDEGRYGTIWTSGTTFDLLVSIYGILFPHTLLFGSCDFHFVRRAMKSASNDARPDVGMFIHP